MGWVISLVGWAVFGVIAGAVARLLVPGEQKMSLIKTGLLGVVGSYAGGLLSWAIFGGGEGSAMQPAGWIMSIVGAVIVLFALVRFGQVKTGDGE